MGRPHLHRRPRALRRTGLLCCPGCNSDLVCPMDWGTLDADHWWLLLRCGECEAWMEVVIDNRQAAALDLLLDRQMAQIRHAAELLDAERMADEAAVFTEALERDLIVAADF